METDMNSTTKQSNNSPAKEANEIRSLNDAELDVVSGGMSHFIWTVQGCAWNAAILAAAGTPIA